jgi:hypothetical protein
MNDLNHRGRWAPLVVVVSVLAVVGVGCGKSDVTPSKSASAVSSEADTTPSPEGTGSEPAQKSYDAGPSAELPSLPIGGSPPEATTTVGAKQCATAGWTGPPTSIPPGIVVTIDNISLSPKSAEKFFKLEGSCTSGGAPPCTTSLRWTSQMASCSAAATQIAPVTEQQSATLILSGHALCGDQSKCDAFKAIIPDSGAVSTVSFEALPGATPGGASSPSSNPPPPSSDQSPPVIPSSSSEGSPS